MSNNTTSGKRKEQESVEQALAGTLVPPVLHKRRRNNKPKQQGPPPPVPDRPRQCHFLLPSKGKYCTLTTRLGHKFCGEHGMHETEGDARKRIPCPFDPTHTAWADDLKAHLYKCNARPRDNPAQFSTDINLTLPKPEAPAAQGREVLQHLSQEQLVAFISKVQDLYAKNVPEIRTLILDHPAMDERKKSIKNIKHAHQQGSLLGHMKRLEMLSNPTTCYIEFGAGRGELSNYLKQAVDDHGTATFVLVDRTPTRNKFDNQILGLEQIKSLVRRLTMDIKDLVLEEVPELRQDVTATVREVPMKEVSKDASDSKEAEEAPKEAEYVEKKPVVALSKHLCGGATDITLKCLINFQESESKKSSLPSPVKGILIALCCHQLCQHFMYPNQEYLAELGISAQEFVYLTRMSSWGICVNPAKMGESVTKSTPATAEATTETDDGAVAGEEDHAAVADKELEELGSHIPTLDFQAREKLGLQCKRLLDVGRVKYLQRNGFDAELVYYVDKETSLENLALMAVPKGLSVSSQ